MVWTVRMAVFLLQYIPSSRFDKSVTPYERRYGAVPNVGMLKVPGCLAWFYNYTEGKKSMLDERAKRGVFVGYDLCSRSYLIYNLATRRVVRSSDVKFDETQFPLATPASKKPEPEDDLFSPLGEPP